MRRFFILIMALFVVIGLSAMPGAKNANNDGRGPLEKITFIHYKDGSAKAKAGPTTSCYGFLAKGAKWKTTEPYLVNPANTRGLAEADIMNAASLSADEWDNKVAFSIFGSASVDYTAAYNNGSIDEKNTLSFGAISQSGVIAVTNVWGYFSGPPQTRELVEWDMLLDQADFDWGIGVPTKMDLQNLITHEIGHSAGMNDLYNSACSQQTMYGYSTEGETSKRDLADGDIKGIKALYP